MAVASILVALLVGVLAALALRARSRRRALAVVGERKPLTDAEFAAMFSSPKEAKVGVSIRALLRPWVPIDVALVRPNDRLCEDLQLDARDGLDSEEFLRVVEERWGVHVPRTEAERILTVAQLASTVAKLLETGESLNAYARDGSI